MSWRTYVLNLTRLKQRVHDRAQYEAAKQVWVLEQQLESEHVQVELAFLCALENLCAKHQLAIQHKKDTMDK